MMFWRLFKKPQKPKNGLRGRINLPAMYSFLYDAALPRHMLEALKLYGIYEFANKENNPTIIGWAKEVGGWIGRWYDKDSIPWCGLFVAVVCKRAGVPFNQKALSALAWSAYGVEALPIGLGDILVFTRTGGGHVGFYVGEDDEAYHVLGGNQSDQVNIKRISKSRLYGARRPAYKGKPATIANKVFLRAEGRESVNEA